MKEPVPAGRLMLPLGLSICLALFGDLAVLTVLVDQLQAVGLSLAAAGVMLGVHRLIRIGANPLAGLLFDRRSRRPLLLLGFLFGVASSLGCGLLRGFWPFLLARLTWGLAWTLMNVGGMTMVVDVTDRHNRGRWMGVYGSWVLAGLALGPIAGGLMVDAWGYRTGMLVCAAIGAAGLAVAAVGLPETASGGSGSVAGRRVAKPDLRALVSAWSEQIAPRLRSHRALTLAALVYLIVQFAGDGVILSTMTLLLQRRFGERLSLGAQVVGVASASGIILGLRSVLAGAAGPAAGRVSDSRGARWPVAAAGLLSGAAGYGLLAWSSSLWQVLLGVTLTALSAGAVQACLAALVGDLTPAGRQGAVMGIYAAVGDVGSTAGPFLAFALASRADLGWVYLLCAVLFLVATALVRPLRRLE